MKNQKPLPPKSSENAKERAARMESIRQQLANGTYRVDSDALADALIQRLEKKPRRQVA